MVEVILCWKLIGISSGKRTDRTMGPRYKVDEEEFLKKLKEAEEEIRQEDAGEKKPPRWTTERLLGIGLGGVFLFILLVYVILGPVEHQIIGQLNSEELVADKLELKGVTVFFENDTQDFLASLYESEQLTRLVETSACLKGDVRNNNTEYHVKDIFYPEIIEQSQRHVRFKTCPRDTIIMLHTHPRTRCAASQTDFDTLTYRHKAGQEELLMLIMCEDNRYALYN
ncbi:MAG: hypothetical protein ACQESE_04205 [Nanobdellota archaeon]